MKKPFFWVKSAVCKIRGEKCFGHTDIPVGVKGQSPDCSACTDFLEWIRERNEEKLKNKEKKNEKQQAGSASMREL